MSPATPAPLTGMLMLRNTWTPEPKPNTSPGWVAVPLAPVLSWATWPFCEPLPMTPATPAPSPWMLALSPTLTSEPGLFCVSTWVRQMF